MSSRLLLVDGHGYAYRSFFAIRGMMSPTGAPVNAVFGFIKALARLRGWLSPTHVGVVWDGGLDASRLGALPGYKAGRPEMPEDLRLQLDALVDFLGAAGVASVCRDGVEADDIIADLAGVGRAGGIDVVVASADKDFLQLVGPGVGVVNPGDKAERVWGVNDVVGKMGVRPEQVVDFLSLVGDGVDNVPGVPGVGVKTAAALLGRFASVDGIYGRLEEVESVRIRGALMEWEGAVRRNQGLVKLRVGLGGLPELDGLRVGVPDWAGLRERYLRWGFRGLAAEAEKMLWSGVQVGLL